MTPRRLTLEQLERINAVSESRLQKVRLTLEKAAWIAGDGAKARRLEMRECVACYYHAGLAGQAFTGWKCRLCGSEDTHATTATPAICFTCADAFGLCSSCGGDIDMYRRSKRFGQRRLKRAKATTPAGGTQT